VTWILEFPSSHGFTSVGRRLYTICLNKIGTKKISREDILHFNKVSKVSNWEYSLHVNKVSRVFYLSFITSKWSFIVSHTFSLFFFFLGCVALSWPHIHFVLQRSFPIVLGPSVRRTSTTESTEVTSASMTMASSLICLKSMPKGLWCGCLLCLHILSFQNPFSAPCISLSVPAFPVFERSRICGFTQTGSQPKKLWLT